MGRRLLELVHNIDPLTGPEAWPLLNQLCSIICSFTRDSSRFFWFTTVTGSMFPVVENSAIHKHTLITPGQERALLDDQHACVLQAK